MKSIFFLLLFSTGMLNAQGWDTLRIMTYNLTYYGEVTSFCTSSNNDIAAKDLNFKTICKHIKPDILVVNEMGASIAYSNRIITKVLNTEGVSKYEKCAIQNNSFSSLVNGVFYNKEKLVLVSQHKVSVDSNGYGLVRVIDVDKFYYKDPDLSNVTDTIFFYVCAAHLKAGSATSDESERGLAAAALMQYLSVELGKGYYFLCGDMNLKGSDEFAFQEFISSKFGDSRFYDPVNKIGSWNNNSNYSHYHTQSTRTSETNGGCYSGGGLDDRFDLILMSGPIIQDTGIISYVANSYHTYGQDGNHFNLPVNNVPNNSEPASVIAALYEMSDHLPVSAEFKIKTLPIDTSVNIGISVKTQPKKCTSWFQEGQLRIQSELQQSTVSLFDMNGKVITSRLLEKGYNAITINDLKGLFIVEVKGENYISRHKLVIID